MRKSNTKKHANSIIKPKNVRSILITFKNKVKMINKLPDYQCYVYLK